MLFSLWLKIMSSATKDRRAGGRALEQRRVGPASFIYPSVPVGVMSTGLRGRTHGRCELIVWTLLGINELRIVMLSGAFRASEAKSLCN